jgi:hypothetical protein
MGAPADVRGGWRKREDRESAEWGAVSTINRPRYEAREQVLEDALLSV